MNIQNTIPTSKVTGILVYFFNDICTYYKDKDHDVSDWGWNVTQKTVEYLFMCGFNNSEICQELSRHKDKSCVMYDNLSPTLWKDSLLKKHAFYLHRELIVVSPAPYFDYIKNIEIVPKFYYMPKIRYTAEDVVDYFYRKLSATSLLMTEYKTDIKTVYYLIRKFDKLDYVQPIDLILYAIDEQVKQEPDTYKLIDITKNALALGKQMQSEIMELRSQNKARNVWR